MIIFKNIHLLPILTKSSDQEWMKVSDSGASTYQAATNNTFLKLLHFVEGFGIVQYSSSSSLILLLVVQGLTERSPSWLKVKWKLPHAHWPAASGP